MKPKDLLVHLEKGDRTGEHLDKIAERDESGWMATRQWFSGQVLPSAMQQQNAVSSQLSTLEQLSRFNSGF